MNTSRREFSLIERFFQQPGHTRHDVLIPAGDDAAVLLPPSQSRLAVTTDTMVAGVHFDDCVSAHALGYKLVAVNMSDLAAMGAEPAWASLALTLPDYDELWLSGFSEGLFAGLADFQCALVGGDITQGPLTLTITAQGFLPPQSVMTRTGAKPGDRIYVSGTLGDAALALALQQGRIHAEETPMDRQALEQRLLYPSPRVMLGLGIRDFASSAIDLSDGLGGDLEHILAASKVGARISLAALPTSAEVAKVATDKTRWQLQLFGGDDYELCFTAAPTWQKDIERISHELALPITEIGVIEQAPGLRFEYRNKAIHFSMRSYSHF